MEKPTGRGADALDTLGAPVRLGMPREAVARRSDPTGKAAASTCSELTARCCGPATETEIVPCQLTGLFHDRTTQRTTAPAASAPCT
jgi:hypothetical protein